MAQCGATPPRQALAGPLLRGLTIDRRGEVTMSAAWTAGERPAAAASPIANSGPGPGRRRSAVQAGAEPREPYDAAFRSCSGEL